jgi:hypothetical protein
VVITIATGGIATARSFAVVATAIAAAGNCLDCRSCFEFGDC